MQTVSLSLFRFDSPASRLWVIGQMAAARLALHRLPAVQFWRLCGSGTEEGFTPRPNWGVWAILAVWPDAGAARDLVANAPVFRRWRARAAEDWSVFLEPFAVRGHWSGQSPFRPEGVPEGPIAALTRATIRPVRALRFWRRVPDISARIGADPNVIFKIGIGEVPMLHQVTFSVWPDADTMAAFARSGPHAAAIRAVRDEGWFREELYARFRIAGSLGSWDGANPLLRCERKDAA